MSRNSEKINIGIVGLGRMGLRHIEAAKKMGMDICALVDISPTVLFNAASKFGIPEDCCFSNLQEMLLKKNPNAVAIATTAPSHAEFTILCAQHKVKYILCEKPMALSLNEADAMIEACNHFGSVLAINHQMMFLPQYTEIKKIIDEKSFGDLSGILVSGSNFGLAMNASHYFEMFRFLTDSNVFSVQAWLEEGTISNPRGLEFEDYSGSLIARNQLGTKMYIDFSVNSGHGLQVIYIFKFGQIIVDELSGYVRTTCRKKEYQQLPTAQYAMPDDIKQYEIKPCELIDSTIMVWNSMRYGLEFPDYKAGLHAMKCLIAAIESNANNSIIIEIDKISIDKSKKFKWA